MFTIYHKPVLNCLDFYERFDLKEILDRPEDFLSFAEGHLLFNACSRRCIELFRTALDMAPLDCASSADFWQKKQVMGLSVQIQSVLEEAYSYYSHVRMDHWENYFIMSAAASILAGASFSVPVYADKQETEGTVYDILLEPGSLRVELIPGNTYRTAAVFENSRDSRRWMYTVEICAKNGYTGTAVLELGGIRNIEIPSGKFIFANVCGGKIVSVLKDSIQGENGLLCRDYEKNCIAMNQEPTGIPFKASSFACLGAGQFLYLMGGQLFLIGIGEDLVPYYLQASGTFYTEVQALHGNYYLLTDQGVVRTQKETPFCMQHYYFSLDDALKEL